MKQGALVTGFHSACIIFFVAVTKPLATSCTALKGLLSIRHAGPAVQEEYPCIRGDTLHHQPHGRSSEEIAEMDICYSNSSMESYSKKVDVQLSCRYFLPMKNAGGGLRCVYKLHAVVDQHDPQLEHRLRSLLSIALT